jgi:hypothetical protein
VNPYFYSLEMLITARMHEQPYLSAMDLLAVCISDHDRQPSELLRTMAPEIFAAALSAQQGNGEAGK